MNVCIVGAGITGLALARALDRRGVDCVVIEAKARAGGVLQSLRVDGRVLELGPQRTRLAPPIERLVRELDLEDALITAKRGLPLYMYFDGRLRRVPLSLRTLAATDLLSARGKTRLLAKPFAGDPRTGETVASYFTRQLGREGYERVAGPLFGGLYGSDPAGMYARHSLVPVLERFRIRRGLSGAFLRSRLRRRPAAPACSFRDGMRTLTDALLRASAGRVRLSAPVRALRRVNRGFEVVIEGDDLVRADRVVLTTPAETAARLLKEAAPTVASRLALLNYNSLAVVHLRCDRKLRGMGYQVALGERSITRGVTFNGSLFPGADRGGVCTAFLGGAQHPDIPKWSDERLARVACDEFREATGCTARTLHVSRTRMPAWDRSWATLDGLEIPEGIRLCANYESRAGIAGRLTQAERMAEELAGG